MKTALPAARFLESALLFTFIAHGLGMVAMAFLLLPGMPGGPHADVAERAAYVAAHPYIWRFGWFWFQLTAFSDLLLATALVKTNWIPRLPAALALVFTLCALGPDQYGQATWTWSGVSVAQSGIKTHDYAAYIIFESHTFTLVAGWGTIGYLTAALCWTWCFAVAGTWNRKLTILSWVTWGIFTISTAVIFLPVTLHPPAWVGTLTAAGNAMAFVLLMIWFIGVTELVLRRSRPITSTGHGTYWRNPSTNLLAKASNLIANSRFVRLIGEYLPTLTMASDVSDVVYVNYLVPSDRLLPFVPAGLQLQRVGDSKSHAVFSIVTYRHGHFGPSCFRRLRRWWPSPIQSNWRIYVVDPSTNKSGVHFLSTAINSAFLSLAARILSEGVPMHLPASAFHGMKDDRSIHTTLEPGSGSSPDLQATFNFADQHLPDTWRQCFESWNSVVGYCVPQERALSPQRWYGRVARQEISLRIPLEACQSLSAVVQSKAAELIVGSSKPLCFRVERGCLWISSRGVRPTTS